MTSFKKNLKRSKETFVKTTAMFLKLTQSVLQVFYKRKNGYRYRDSRATFVVSCEGQHSPHSPPHRHLVDSFPSSNKTVSSHLMNKRTDPRLPNQ